VKSSILALMEWCLQANAKRVPDEQRVNYFGLAEAASYIVFGALIAWARENLIGWGYFDHLARATI